MLSFTSSFLLAEDASDRPAGLVPVTYVPKTDTNQFRWDIEKGGAIKQGTNNCFNGAGVIFVNGTSMSSISQHMTPDGLEYYLSASFYGGYSLSRHVTLDLTRSVVRYVDRIRNNDFQPKETIISIKTALGRHTAVQLLTNTGQKNPRELRKEDSGLLAYCQPQTGQLSVMMYVKGPGAQLVPSCANTSNFRFTYNYKVTIPPGESVAIIHGLAQRRIEQLPSQDQLKTLFQPFTSERFLSGLSALEKKSIRNRRLFSSASSTPFRKVTIESLGIEPAVVDLMAMGKQTKLQGNLLGNSLRVKTSYGEANIATDQIAAIVGKKSSLGNNLVLLRDGDVYSGTFQTDQLQFEMNTGHKVPLAMETLDRLIRKRSEQQLQIWKQNQARLQLHSGDAVLVTLAHEEQLMCETRWGSISVPLETISWLSPTEEPEFHRLLLDDGTNLKVKLKTERIPFSTKRFGECEFEVGTIHSLVRLLNKDQERKKIPNLSTPHLVLSDDHYLAGRLTAPTLTFLVQGQAVPIPPSQLHTVQRQFFHENQKEGTLLFRGQLWDAGMITGELEVPEKHLSVKAHHIQSVLKIPVQEILAIHVPSPVVPQNVKEKIAQHIERLGDANYRERERAERALRELGLLAKPQLEQASESATDPEIKRRTSALLDRFE